MQCPKCKTVNVDTEQYCRRCHMTLLYKCPSCGATQRTGGKCAMCGVDFAKYLQMVVAQEQIRANQSRERTQGRVSIWKQLILIPLTGGLSLFRFFRNRA